MVDKNIKTRIRKDKSGKEHTDYEAYVGVDPFTNKPVRITRSDMKKLSKALADFYTRHRVGGDTAVHLSAAQAMDAKNAYDALASAGMNEVSLTQAITTYIGGMNAKNTNLNITIGEAFERYFLEKFGVQLEDGKYPVGLKANESEMNPRNTFYMVGKWVNSCSSKKLTSITRTDIADYLAVAFKNNTPKTYNQHLQHIKTFFNWCCKYGVDYLVKSPIQSLPYKAIPWEEPKYMKVEDVERLFRLLERIKVDYPQYLAYATVNFFCGCRAIEVQRMATNPDSCKVNIEGETVRIAKGKGFQRGKRPRAFQIHPTGLAWIKSFDFEKGISMVTKKTALELYEFVRSHKIPVFHNCGRHTFITYHVAAYGNPLVTQAMVGTGGRMMAENYRGLSTKKEGDAYFNILPLSGTTTTEE
jgi:integrase